MKPTFQKNSKKKYRRDTEELKYVNPDFHEDPQSESSQINKIKQQESEPESLTSDQIKSKLTEVTDLDSDDSSASEQRQKSINAEILEIVKEDEELKKTQKSNPTKLNIDQDWKAKDDFDAQLKQLSSEEFKEWFSEIPKKAVDFLCLSNAVSSRDVLGLYQSTIRTGLLTIRSAIKSGLDKKFLLEYGHDLTLLHQLQTPENVEHLRETLFLSLCTNQPGKEKVSKHPILLIKAVRKNVEEEMEIIKSYMLALAHRFINNEFFALLADAQKVIFLRFDGSEDSSKLWVSEEFKEDLIAEFGKFRKAGKLTEDSEILYQVIFCILNGAMKKCEKFLKARNLM